MQGPSGGEQQSDGLNPDALDPSVVLGLPLSQEFHWKERLPGARGRAGTSSFTLMFRISESQPDLFVDGWI